MSREKADVFRRIVAHLIDVLVALILASVISVIFPLLWNLVFAAYLLLKDGLLFAITKQDIWKNKSIGKRLLNLEVASENGATIDLLLSAKRNLTLVAGTLLELTIFSSVLAGMAGAIVGLVEIYLLFTDPYGRRLGDQWAHTQVTPEQ